MRNSLSDAELAPVNYDNRKQWKNVTLIVFIMCIRKKIYWNNCYAIKRRVKNEPKA